MWGIVIVMHVKKKLLLILNYPFLPSLKRKEKKLVKKHLHFCLESPTEVKAVHPRGQQMAPRLIPPNLVPPNL